MPQKFPLNGFKWKKNVSKFDEGLIKDYDKIVIKDIFLKWMLNIQKIYLIFIVIYHSYQRK